MYHSQLTTTIFISLVMERSTDQTTQNSNFILELVSMHHKSLIYNKPTRCISGSIVFINNYKCALNVSDAFLHPSSGAL